MPTRCSARRQLSAATRRTRRQPVGPIMFTEDAVEAILACVDESTEKATVVLFIDEDFFVRTGIVVAGTPADRESVEQLIGVVEDALESSSDLPYVVVGLWTDRPLPPDFELAAWTHVMLRWDARRATDPDAPELLDLVLVNPTGYTKFQRE